LFGIDITLQYTWQKFGGFVKDRKILEKAGKKITTH